MSALLATRGAWPAGELLLPRYDGPPLLTGASGWGSARVVAVVGGGKGGSSGGGGKGDEGRGTQATDTYISFIQLILIISFKVAYMQ